MKIFYRQLDAGNDDRYNKINTEHLFYKGCGNRIFLT